MENLKGKKFLRNISKNPKITKLNSFIQNLSKTRTMYLKEKQHKEALLKELEKYDYADPEYKQINREISNSSKKISTLHNKMLRCKTICITVLVSLGLLTSAAIGLYKHNQSNYIDAATAVSTTLGVSDEDIKNCDDPELLTTHALNSFKSIVANQIGVSNYSEITIDDSSFVVNPGDINLSPEIRALGDGYYTDICLRNPDNSIIAKINFFDSYNGGYRHFSPSSYANVSQEEAEAIAKAVSAISNAQRNPESFSDSKKAIIAISNFNKYVSEHGLPSVETNHFKQTNDYLR